MDTFNHMPLAVIIDGRFLAMHAGISPDIDSTFEINNINRNNEPPISGPLCDILWSDPIDNEDGCLMPTWAPNFPRGCSYFYGYAAISKFL